MLREGSAVILINSGLRGSLKKETLSKKGKKTRAEEEGKRTWVGGVYENMIEHIIVSKVWRCQAKKKSPMKRE